MVVEELERGLGVVGSLPKSFSLERSPLVEREREGMKGMNEWEKKKKKKNVF